MSSIKPLVLRLTDSARSVGSSAVQKIGAGATVGLLAGEAYSAYQSFGASSVGDIDGKPDTNDDAMVAKIWRWRINNGDLSTLHRKMTGAGLIKEEDSLGQRVSKIQKVLQFNNTQMLDLIDDL